MARRNPDRPRPRGGPPLRWTSVERETPPPANFFRRVYDGGEDWKATLRSTLHLDDALAEKRKQMWVCNREIPKQANVSPPPEMFAAMAVD